MIEIVLFIVGIIGLIGGNLTVLPDFPIQGRRARIVGLILIIPFLLLVSVVAIISPLAITQNMPSIMEVSLMRWLNSPLSTILTILGAFIYLYSTQPTSKPSTLMFWLIAAIPAMGLLITQNLTSLYQTLFDQSMKLPLPLWLKLELPDVIIGFFIPVVISFAVNLIIPVATNKLSAVLFSLPVYLIHIYSYAISGWILPGLASVAFPGDTPGAGFQEIMNGFVSIQISSLLVLFVAFAVWIAARIRRKE